MPDFWSVDTWIAETADRRPVESVRFRADEKDAADQYADRQRARIVARGWTHVVTVTPGMLHKP